MMQVGEADSKAMKRPNILILYTDQQRWDTLGANGNHEIITPNLDKLASQSVNFTRHFVQNPVCMPSRISMLSGRYPSSLGDHLRFGKGYPADDSVSRVPLLLSAPEGRRDHTHHAVVEAVDILPTLLELAGIQIPPFLQGESLASVLKGRDARQKSIALTEGDGWKSLRTARYRYLVHSDGRENLWDIDADPGEYHDVAGCRDYADALADCGKTLLQRLLEIERPLPRAWTY